MLYLQAFHLGPRFEVEHTNPKIRSSSNETIPPWMQGCSTLVTEVDWHGVALHLSEIV